MNQDRPVVLMTILQGVCLAAAVLTGCALVMLWSAPWWAAAGGLLVAMCVLYALWQAYRMCGLLKTTSAFCMETVTCLGRIAAAAAVAGVLLIPLGLPLMNWLLLGLPPIAWAVRAGLPAFTAFSLAVMVRAVQVLMRRAVTLQTDNDLTV